MTDHRPLAERIARERWNAGLVPGIADWDGLSQNVRDEVLNDVEATLDAIEAAGLAIVEAEDGR